MFNNNTKVQFCQFKQTYTGVCGRSISQEKFKLGQRTCDFHYGKVSKYKAPSAKFRGSSKFYKETDNFTGLKEN